MRKTTRISIMVLAALFVSATAVFGQVGGPPMVTIESISPTSGTGNSPLNVTVTYSLTKSSPVSFWVDYGEVGSTSSPAGNSSWTFTGLTGGYHALEVSCPGNAQYVTYLVNPTITATANSGGTITPSGSVHVNYGSNQSFTITASTGYNISEVDVNGASQGALNSYTFTNVTHDQTIVANFAPQVFTVTVEAEPNNYGSTYGLVGLTGPGLPVNPTYNDVVSAQFHYGDFVTCWEQPNGNCYFVDWTVNGNEVSTSNPYSFTVTGNITVDGNFGVNAGNSKQPGQPTIPVSEIPKTFAINQNYPNPFNPTTQIRYQLPKASNVSIRVYNMLGQEVAILADGKKDAGYYSVTFNGSGLSSGVYLVRLVITPQGRGQALIRTMKMMLVK